MIKFGEDIGAPLAVAAADILTTQYQPTWNKWVRIGLAAGGYILGGWMGIGGTFVKNLGIASAPLAIESIYSMIKEGVGAPAGSSARLVMRPTGNVANRITRWPAPASAPEFNVKPAD